MTGDIRPADEISSSFPHVSDCYRNVPCELPVEAHRVLVGMRRAVGLVLGFEPRLEQPNVPAHLAGVRVPATVPGCVHLDLLAAGLIPDPYLDGNEALVAWIGRTDWRYETTVPCRRAAAIAASAVAADVSDRPA